MSNRPATKPELAQQFHEAYERLAPQFDTDSRYKFYENDPAQRSYDYHQNGFNKRATNAWNKEK